MKLSEHPINTYPAELYCDDDRNEVTYALCVKVHNTPEAWDALTSDEADGACAEWWSNAARIASGLGLGVAQAGRSGGWCVFTDRNGEPLSAYNTAELHAEGGACRVTALALAGHVALAAELVRATLTQDALTELAEGVRESRIVDGVFVPGAAFVTSLSVWL